MIRDPAPPPRGLKRNQTREAPQFPPVLHRPHPTSEGIETKLEHCAAAGGTVPTDPAPPPRGLKRNIGDSRHRVAPTRSDPAPPPRGLKQNPMAPPCNRPSPPTPTPPHLRGD